MANARAKPARRAGATRQADPPAGRRRRNQSHHAREVTAVACLALAIFLAFVLYFGWRGGFLGQWLQDFSRWAVGVYAYLAPLVLVYCAVALTGGQTWRPSRAASFGIAFLSVAFLLAAAADSFGLFSSGRITELFQMSYMRHHGGAVGELIWAALHLLIGRLGVNILVLALGLAGLLLASGSSLGLWANRSRRGMSAAGRAARTRAHVLAERRREALDEQHRREAAAASESAIHHHGPAASSHPRRVLDGAHHVPEIFSDGGEPAARASAEATAAMLADGGPAAASKELGGPANQLSLGEEVGDATAADSVFAPAPAEQRHWVLPDPSILRQLGEGHGETPTTIEEVSRRLVETLGHFGIAARVVDTVSGPRVTRYEMQLAPGVKVNRVTNLKDDLAYALAATEIRVQAPIPGKTAVGVEVPNVQPNFVGLGDIYGAFPANASPLAFWLGKDIAGKPVLADLAKMVHILIAGTTGSGKSGCINCVISSILLRASPEQVRMIMIDPKKVELSHFDGIPHLLAPVVTNMKNASYVLANVVREMEHRYERMSRAGNAQNIRELNKKLERTGDQPLPYIVLVIDELADLMMVSPAEVEDCIIRLGQLGRGAGIHLVVATQRPSVDVVTGMIKTNIPSRIAFAVSSQTDSRVILDTGGAESLLGDGDMLFHPFGSSRLLRVQGAFMTPGEMKLITEHWKRQAAPEFDEELLEMPAVAEGEVSHGGGSDEDELLADAIMTVVNTGAASVALLQRRLRIGYARAGRLIDIMESRGIVSGYDGSKARSVLIREDELPATLATARGEVGAPAVPVDSDDLDGDGL
jgi:S-DNA-T family DNA segregation ATPase FtsK/SpoIIIE